MNIGFNCFGEGFDPVLFEYVRQIFDISDVVSLVKRIN